ncbi:hypothetical protein BV22DRAFT_1199936 [Leucogyrophana mollusca]|uniref:Uncharacterized protein n=1 Tax=Leucogyrophana mollusca TaxID=85980 RepID=A0ACB8B085_9AGAM|nr:hypothetical protein BV22DRAFT_1199936 [Leucogyrophana mollusca]
MSGMPVPSSSSVSFPSSDSVQPLPIPHLPFRRISLPSQPNRQSVASLASFDSLAVPEEHPQPGTSPSAVSHVRQKRRSLNPAARGHGQRRVVPVVDESREAKRRKVIREFYDTEKTYVDGLDLIYGHFLTPIIASLDTPKPLLTRAQLTSIFSNFIDVWNFHHSFFSALDSLLSPTWGSTPPPLSPLLLSHFPYLSLYTPFVTPFSTALASLSSLPSTSPSFAAFITRQESDPRCGKLHLADWLLTVVQRCPRYLLLLKDLLACTHPEDVEYKGLEAAYSLVEKITTSLNTSLHTHAQTLALLSLQRSTANLPFTLIAPGRTLLKRGTLLYQGDTLREREFLLFSDCLLWIEKEGEREHHRPTRSIMARTRSKSEAELTALRARRQSGEWTPTRTPKKVGSDQNERWSYKGHITLIDVEIVLGGDTRFEVLSPEGSFAVFAESSAVRDDWASAIRTAKSALLASLSATHPNSTLTSSASTNHVRRALRALPYDPSTSPLAPSSPQEGDHVPRAPISNFLPPVWIPDAKTDACMRCSRPFGWRHGRRRHHCRLCGRCVCAACSEKTFYVSDPSKPDTDSKPARACNECYEAVFPVLPSTGVPSDSPTVTPESSRSSASSPPPATPTLTFPSWLSIPSRQGRDAPEALMAMAMAVDMPPPVSRRASMDIGVRGGSPLRLNVGGEDSPVKSGPNGSPLRQSADGGPLKRLSSSPSKPLSGSPLRNSLEVGGSPLKRFSIPSPSSRFPRTSPTDTDDGTVKYKRPDQLESEPLSGEDEAYGRAEEGDTVRPIRIRPTSRARPRSYYDILEDFHEHEHEHGRERSAASSLGTALSIPESEEAVDTVSGSSGPEAEGTAGAGPGVGRERKAEDTARRHKRFSLPAVALQTTPVIARSSSRAEIGRPGVGRRLSLVLGGGAGGASKEEVRGVSGGSTELGQESGSGDGRKDRGMAASALLQLLRGKRRER